MQSGFDGSDRGACKCLDFREFVAFSVVQKQDDAVFITERLECTVKRRDPFAVSRVGRWIRSARQCVDVFAGKRGFADHSQTLAGVAAALVDKEVVLHARKPRPQVIDSDQLIQFRVRLDQNVLKQVFSTGSVARKAPCQAIQAVEMRSDQRLECVCRVVYGR